MACAVIGTTPTQIDESQGCIRLGPIAIAPGVTVDLDTLFLVQIPAGGPDDLLKRMQVLQASSAAPERATTRAKWAATSFISTKDQTVQELFDKARLGLPGMIAADGTMDAGIFEYGAQWVRDTSNTVIGAIHTGQFELARNTLERVLTRMISKEGVTMIANAFDPPEREQFDQMGELLHVLKSYRDWTGDDSLIRQHRDLLLAAIERPLHERFRDETGWSTTAASSGNGCSTTRTNWPTRLTSFRGSATQPTWRPLWAPRTAPGVGGRGRSHVEGNAFTSDACPRP